VVPLLKTARFDPIDPPIETTPVAFGFENPFTTTELWWIWPSISVRSTLIVTERFMPVRRKSNGSINIYPRLKKWNGWEIHPNV
jgi:hypothetical protein